MGSLLKNGNDPGAIVHEVNESPDEIRARLAASNGTVHLTTRKGGTYMVTEHTLVADEDDEE